MAQVKGEWHGVNLKTAMITNGDVDAILQVTEETSSKTFSWKQCNYHSRNTMPEYHLFLLAGIPNDSNGCDGKIGLEIAHLNSGTGTDSFSGGNLSGVQLVYGRRDY